MLLDWRCLDDQKANEVFRVNLDMLMYRKNFLQVSVCIYKSGNSVLKKLTSLFRWPDVVAPAAFLSTS